MLDLLSLSFLPAPRWRDTVGRLRAGEFPSDILLQHCSARSRKHRRPRPSAEALRARAEKALAIADRAGLRAIPWGHADYPPSVAAISDPPFVLWVRGGLGGLARPCIAIVGSRAGSPYAISVATRLAEDLARAGCTVVSGLARGVDAAAHRGALQAAGRTVAVLGCGADRVYPIEHARLAGEVAQSGAVLSELAPGTPPHPTFFPLRNRIISALSRGVVIVEAGEKSGSLITARCALDQGRDVMAVPGNVLTDRNRGGHALLRDGARLVESAADILDEIGCAGLAYAPQVAEADAVAEGLLEHLVIGEPCDLDQIAGRSAWPINRILPRLLELEIEGRLKRVEGGRFVRV